MSTIFGCGRERIAYGQIYCNQFYLRLMCVCVDIAHADLQNFEVCNRISLRKRKSSQQCYSLNIVQACLRK